MTKGNTKTAIVASMRQIFLKQKQKCSRKQITQIFVQAGQVEETLILFK